MDRVRLSNLEDVVLFCSDKNVELNKQRVLEGKVMKGLLVEADALYEITSQDQFKYNFLRIAKTCEAVICCRVSPGQKADVVRLIKNDD